MNIDPKFRDARVRWHRIVTDCLRQMPPSPASMVLARVVDRTDFGIPVVDERFTEGIREALSTDPFPSMDDIFATLSDLYVRCSVHPLTTDGDLLGLLQTLETIVATQDRLLLVSASTLYEIRKNAARRVETDGVDE